MGMIKLQGSPLFATFNDEQLKKNIEFKKRSDGQKVDFMVELAMDVMRKKATPYLIATGEL